MLPLPLFLSSDLLLSAKGTNKYCDRGALMDFGFSEEQELLRQSAVDFLSKECPMTYVRQMMDDELGHSEELWKKIEQLSEKG